MGIKIISRHATSIVALFAATALLLACQQTAQPRGESQTGSLKVGASPGKAVVVSTAGASLHRMHVGHTVFGNSADKVDVAPNLLDDPLSDLLASSLSTPSQLFVTAQRPSGLALTVNSLRTRYENPIWRAAVWEGWQDHAPVFRRIAQTAQASTVVLLHPAQNGDSMGGGSGAPRGLSIYTERFMTQPLTFAMVQIILIDGSTGMPYERFALLAEDGIFKATPRGAMSSAYREKPLSSYSATDYETFLSSIRRKLSESFTRSSKSVLENLK